MIIILDEALARRLQEEEELGHHNKYRKPMNVTTAGKSKGSPNKR